MKNWISVVFCLFSLSAMAQFRVIQNSTNLSVQLPPEFAGADISLESCSNLVGAAWTTVLQTNAAFGGELPLGAVILPDLAAGGGSSTNSGGGGVPPLPTVRLTGSTDAGTVGSAAVFYRASANTLLDSDGDGLDNLREYEIGTDYLLRDTSGDGLPDGWLVQHGLAPLAFHTLGDADGDGFTNQEELLNGTDPDSADTNSVTGAVATVRFYYDEDDRLTDCCCRSGAAQKTVFTASHNMSEEIAAR